jgi:hypothetical protein
MYLSSSHETITSSSLYSVTIEVANTSFEHETKNFKIFHAEIECRCMECIYLAQVRDQ